MGDARATTMAVCNTATMLRLTCVIALMSSLFACASPSASTSSPDAGDAATPDASVDAAFDAAPNSDAAPEDGAPLADAMSDAFVEADMGGASLDARGIYAAWPLLRGAQSPTTTLDADELASLDVGGITGVLVAIGWDVIEPTEGAYSFDVLDARLIAARDAHKTVELSIVAGALTPDWLFTRAMPAVGLTFAIAPHGGATGHCSAPFTLAHPWDAVFLERFTLMLSALATHLRGAGLFDTIYVVKLSGINRTTSEFRLPQETPSDIACATDAPALWLSAGYTPGRVLDAFGTIVESYVANFPGKLYSMSIITPHGSDFPSFDEAGNLVPTASAVNVTDLALGIAGARIPEHQFVIQHDFLMPDYTAPAIMLDNVAALNARIAFQTNNYLNDTSAGVQCAACGGTVASPIACTESTYLDELHAGVYPDAMATTLRSTYIEVHLGELAFPSAIATASTELRP